MNLMNEALSNAITLTLLHSLWQGFVAFLILKLVLVQIPSSDSSMRYGLATASLLIIAAASIITFLSVLSNHSGEDPLPASAAPWFSGPSQFGSAPGSHSWWTIVSDFVMTHSSILSITWLCGVVALLLRFTGSYFYVHRLTNLSTPADLQWIDKVNDLARDLGLKSWIDIFENNTISAPFVTGFLKPVIVIPSGMISGLSTDQVEAIFIHELAHIRRNDYVMNLFQSLTEAVLFFNPFVWIISGMIRIEREHCCDDAVLAAGSEKKVYALALTYLEEVRLVNVGPALSFAQNKNQLLTRIKRIMEKSEQKHSLWGKMLPVLLVAVGLVCASWYSIQRQENRAHIDHKDMVAGDTTVKGKNTRVDGKSRKASREKPGALDNPEAHSPIEEKTVMSAFPIPPVPDLPSFEVPDFPPMPGFTDSLPPFGNQWIQFEESFRRKFEEQFQDFYQNHQVELEKIMSDVRKLHAIEFEAPMLARIEARELSLKVQEEVMKQHQREMESFESRMRRFEEESVHMRELEKEMKILEEKMKIFEDLIRKELIKDGYLRSSEPLKNLHWSKDGEIRINDKKIRESDRARYQALHDQYFPSKNSGSAGE
jgi:bla regulator protein blaR1